MELKANVRGRDVFLIQPTCAPANDNLMELLIMAEACKRSSAGRITAVVPYFGYARQDRKVSPRAPISARLVADLIQAALDRHGGQQEPVWRELGLSSRYVLSRLVRKYDLRVRGRGG